MKIVQLIPELNEGGVERGVIELSRELCLKGIQSVVISHGGKLVPQLEADGALHVKHDICSKNIFTAPWRIFQLYKILKHLKPDILHVRSRVPAWMLFFANAFLHIKCVSTVHGFNSISAYSAIMTKSDHVICVSGAIKRYIQTHYQTEEGKITIIPRGIDLERFNPNHADQTFIEAFKAQFRLDNRLIITTVGRITQLKDLETFIDAIAHLKERYPQVIGLIVGGIREDKQHYFQTLQKRIEFLHVKEYIHFCGSTDKVADVYALSDVVISSSKKPESFGRSVAEAIAMNTPVVATAHGGVLDIIQEGENGYFSTISDGEDLAEKIIKAFDLRFDGYSYIAEHFSLQQMVDKTLKVYHDILQPHVCHINLSAQYGGAEKNFVETCNALCKHPLRVIAVVPQSCEYLSRFHPDVHVVKLTTNTSRHNPFLKRALKNIITRFNPKIVHTHSAKATELIYDIHHNTPSFAHFGTKHNDRKGAIFNKIQYPIAVSQKVATSILQQNVPIIYNGITYQEPSPKLKEETLTLLCVGRLDPIKQFDLIIDTLPTLPFTCKMLIAGVGPQKEALETKIKSLHLEEAVHLLGFVEDIPSLMATSDLVIVNSKSEGFSYTILEALFYAPMLISTPVGIAPEFLDDTMLFHSHELREKLIDVKENYTHYKKIMAPIKEKAQNNLTNDASTTQLITLYRSHL